MRICLDLRYFTKSGASSYINNLVPQVLEQDRENSYVLVKYAEQSFPFESRAEAVVVVPGLPRLMQVLWVFLVLPWRLFKLGVDLYHPLKFAGTFWPPSRMVLTVHSIGHKYKGEFPVSSAAHLYNVLYAHWYFKHCARIIAVSDFLKEYSLDMHGVDEENIDVIPHGVQDSFRPLPADEVAAVRARNGLQNDYVICVGNVFPVKNHITAVRAFAKIAGERHEDLVILGAKTDPYFEKVTEEVAKLDMGGRVKFLGFVEGDDLVGILNGARAMLFPSLSEGCPISMIEAFKCGLPVVASRRGGLADIGRDTALFVDDPFNADGFAVHLLRLLTSAEFHEEVRQLSLRRAVRHSWRVAASQHLETYRKAGATLPPSGAPARAKALGAS